VFDLIGLKSGITPRMDVPCRIRRKDGTSTEIKLTCRIDTVDEVEYYRSGGILTYVLKNLSTSKSA
jgi:aconitate hydratase